eukprot:jgi/Mesen1/4617/ME000236S03870
MASSLVAEAVCAGFCYGTLGSAHGLPNGSSFELCPLKSISLRRSHRQETASVINTSRKTDARIVPASSRRRSLACHMSLSDGLFTPQSSSWTSQYAPSMPRLQDTDPSSLLLQQRILFLGAQVDDVIADALISQMLLLDAQDPTQDIKLFINSPGGSVTAGMGIYDAMKVCKADVSTICFGLAASMGAFLLAAGTKGKRYCMPNARVMIHQPLGGTQGAVREMMYHKAKLTKILARVTNQPEDKVYEDTDRDNFMNAWEAVEYGLVDAVIDGDKPGLVAPIGVVQKPDKTHINPFWTIKETSRQRKNYPGEERLYPGYESE